MLSSTFFENRYEIYYLLINVVTLASHLITDFYKATNNYYCLLFFISHSY